MWGTVQEIEKVYADKAASSQSLGIGPFNEDVTQLRTFPPVQQRR